LRQLVWSITHETSRDDKTTEVVLLCHRTFARSIDLLNLLLERFKETTQDDSGDMRANFNIQVKVGNMLRHWIKSFYELDYHAQPELIATTLEFVNSMSETEDLRLKELMSKIKITLEQKEKEQKTLDEKK